MDEPREGTYGECGGETDRNRTVDFTIKHGTRACERCFVMENPRPTRPESDWPKGERSRGRRSLGVSVEPWEPPGSSPSKSLQDRSHHGGTHSGDRTTGHALVGVV
jgi:hypothetical protein